MIDAQPHLVVPAAGRYAGRPCHYWPSFDRLLPVVAGGDGGAGGEAGAGQGEGGSGDAGGEAGAGGAAGDGAGGGAGSDKSFTQADVDRIVADRLKRAKATPPADYDDLKAKASKLDEIEAKNKTELEKAQDAQRKSDERAAAAEKRVQETARRAAIERAAVKAKAADPEDVFAVLETSPKYRDMVTMDDDGQVNGVEDAIKAILTDKPHLVGKSTSAGDGDGGARSSGGAKPTNLEDAVLAAMKSG